MFWFKFSVSLQHILRVYFFAFLFNFLHTQISHHCLSWIFYHPIISEPFLLISSFWIFCFDLFRFHHLYLVPQFHFHFFLFFSDSSTLVFTMFIKVSLFPSLHHTFSFFFSFIFVLPFLSGRGVAKNSNLFRVLSVYFLSMHVSSLSRPHRSLFSVSFRLSSLFCL